MTPEEFQDKLLDQGIQITDSQCQQFATYFELLVQWNKKINLTAITDKKEVYLKHFYDSVIPSFSSLFKADGNLCDVGAGAGFPSLPMKILFPELKVTIVDSLNKRIQFLETVVTELGLTNVSLYHSRAEDFGQNKAFRGSYDLVTARAVARLNVLTELCLPLVKLQGYFFAMKASKSEEELAEAQTVIHLLGGKVIQEIVQLLPVTGDKRHVIIIQKKKETPRKYPRKAGLPNKQPIV